MAICSSLHSKAPHACRALPLLVPLRSSYTQDSQLAPPLWPIDPRLCQASSEWSSFELIGDGLVIDAYFCYFAAYSAVAAVD